MEDKHIGQSVKEMVPGTAQELGDALESVITHVGEIGRYQKLLFFCMAPFGMFWSFLYFGQMFITVTPQEHWCKVPDLADLTPELRRTLSIPIVNGEYDHCSVYDANWTEVLETLQPPTGAPVVGCQHGWEFLFDDIPYSTIVNEREWVCDNAYYVPWAQSINFAGAIAGGILCGVIADTYGRIPALVVANLLGFIGGVATIFTTGFWDFSICRFIAGMACDSAFLMIYILVMEYVGTKYRTWVANLSISLFFGSGCLIQPWIALWVSDWRNFMLVTSVPMLIVLVTPFIVPESARWLASKGRVEKVVKIFKRFEKINNTKIPQAVMDEFVMVAKSFKEKEESVIVLFKNPSIRVILMYLVGSFMGVAVVFDGLIRVSENLGLDFFVTFTVTSATEIPSIAILVVLLDRFGRRWLVTCPMLVAGVLSVVAAFVPRGVMAVSLATAARFFNNMSYGAVIQWTPELMPTAVRASGASLIHMSAFAALMISPFIVYSDRAWDGLSLVIVGGIAVASGLMALLLPETRGRRMPQTMEEGEELANSRPFIKKSVALAPSRALAT
ncbi:carcinine transporter-like [Aricia agestis]|uniref:carcinine transporter-like n=1 Tax=Aricia agestis TaxID=91739 RepID=UPI001C20A73E|nr:carcinine transporter-like [Aricia agestis]